MKNKIPLNITHTIQNIQNTIYKPKDNNLIISFTKNSEVAS